MAEEDELDVMVAVTEPTFPGCSIRVKPIALLKMYDDEKRNDKVLGVPLTDPGWEGLDELDELPGDLADEVIHFFEVYTDLEGKDRTIEDGDRARTHTSASRPRASGTNAQARRADLTVGVAARGCDAGGASPSY